MPNFSREQSRDRELVLRHQRSFGSESGRLSVPMWDSSDPDRAPPPLPLNPLGTNGPTTRPNTSATVAAAAQALAERARESIAPSPYVVNDFPMRSRSPDKSPTKTPQHKRLQSLQTRSTKELKEAFENNNSYSSINNATAVSNIALQRESRPSTPSSARERDVFSSSPERSTSRAETPTPGGNSYRRNTTPVRSAGSVGSGASFTNENTPPSNVLTIKSPIHRQDEDQMQPLADISNGSSVRSAAVGNETLQEQMRNLTAIATTLQKEMSALSRRSRDNATDLLSLKEATNSRHRDLRDSLKELITTNKTDGSRSNSALEHHNHLIDNKPFSSPPFNKSVSLPRMPSVHFDTTMDLERAASPSPYSVEGAASVAMLEKIIREMVTKEGQERLLLNLSELLKNSSVQSTEACKKVEELVEFIKDKSNSQALVTANGDSNKNSPPGQELNFDSPKSRALAKTNFRHSSTSDSMPGLQGPHILNDDLVKLLQRIKDSVLSSGGLTNEVKQIVRDLRGEVLGMGRELGRKLDSMEPPQNADDKSISADDLFRVVQEGLSDLKQQMDAVIQTRRRESANSAATRSAIDSNEVYAVVKHALADSGLDKPQEQNIALDQQAILDAIREAYEAYKPEIEVTQIGLDRDEVLECLKKGLEDYQSSKTSDIPSGINRDEVLAAVQEGLQYFTPPAPLSEATELKEEILMTVRDCLESFKASISQDHNQGAVTREDVSDAVRAELGSFRQESGREVEISSQDLYNAVKAGLETMERPLGEYGDQLLTSLHDVLDRMRNDLKDFVETNSRDNEQVLQTLGDGFERLRSEVESYVDRAQDVTGKDEIIDTLKTGLESMRANIDEHTDQSSRGLDSSLDTNGIMTLIKSEFDRIQESLSIQSSSDGLSAEAKDDIVNAITEGLIAVKDELTGRTTDGLNEEILDSVKEEFENLRHAVLAGSSVHKDEVLEAVHASIGALHAKVDAQTPSDISNDEIIAVIREELDALKENIGVSTSRSIESGSHEGTLETVREALDTIKAQIASNQRESTQESLGLIKEELDLIRSSLGGNLLTNGLPTSDKDEIMNALRDGLAELHETQSSRGFSELGTDSSFGAIQEEFERLRQSIASTITRNTTQNDSGEIIDIIRIGLEDLRSDLGKSLNNPERFASSNSEILEALNDGLDGLRADISKLTDKPVDMTVSYEILDTLKDGLTELRADMNRLAPNESTNSSRDPVSTGEVVLAELGNTLDRGPATEMASVSNLKKDDLEKMEVMLTHLQIKVDALDHNMQNSAESHSTKDQESHWGSEDAKLAFSNIETLLRELHSTTSNFMAQGPATTDGAASKEDTDAIETLLINTKAKIEETLDNAVTREQIEAIETSLKLNGECVDTLLTRIDETMPTKLDMTALELLVQGATTTLNELKDRASGDNDKADFEFVESLCIEIKDKIAELPLSESIPSKEEIEKLTDMLLVFKGSHELFKDRYEQDIALTAKLFDDRREEAKDLKDQISDLKDFVEESAEAMKVRIKRGNADVRALDEILESIEEKIEEVPKTSSEIHELLLAFKEEFEKAHTHLEDIKTGQEDSSAAALTKQEEMRDSVVADLKERLEERFNEFLSRQDDQYALFEKTSQDLTEKAAQQEELLENHKAMSEELKLTIDTLGGAVAGIYPALIDATEKMTDDSRTVFTKIDEVHTKLDESALDSKTEHQLTRDEVAKSLAAVANVHQEVTGFNPKAMDLLSSLVKIAGDHFDYSKKFQETSTQHAQKSREEFSSIKDAFATLPVPRIEAPPIPPPKEYDDTKLHNKLDQILSHNRMISEKPAPGLDKLNQMHEQIVSAASQLSGLISAQRKAISDENDSKAAEARAAADSLTKALREREQLEITISSLKETKDSLTSNVGELKSEGDALLSQKMRLTAEMSSLETALSIRREELQMMDARAEALERRILERVMDHSRALLIAKAPKSTANMSLKRVTSNISHSDASTTTPTSVVNSGISIAMRAKPLVRKSARVDNTGGRRILSLSQITNNVPNGASAISPTPRNVTSGLSNIKRSQSVKNPAARKASWVGTAEQMEQDKENSMLDGDEQDYDNADRDSESIVSRSVSFNGTHFSGTDRKTSYGLPASEYSYDTGSYITGTDIDRRSSYGSTIRSTVHGNSAIDESIYEEEEEEEEEAEGGEHGDRASSVHGDGVEEHEALVQQAIPLVQSALKKYVEANGWRDANDSGLGSDLPTAALSSTVVGSDSHRPDAK